MQIMTPEQAENYRFDILDITKVWPHGDFPPIKIGKLVLNLNPTNYFADSGASSLQSFKPCARHWHFSR